MLLLTTRFGDAVAVNTYNTCMWKAAHRDGFRVLRHTYASVATLARWLGYSPSVITLRHYAHFMPEAGDGGVGPSMGAR